MEKEIQNAITEGSFCWGVLVLIYDTIFKVMRSRKTWFHTFAALQTLYIMAEVLCLHLQLYKKNISLFVRINRQIFKYSQLKEPDGWKQDTASC